MVARRVKFGQNCGKSLISWLINTLPVQFEPTIARTTYYGPWVTQYLYLGFKVLILDSYDLLKRNIKTINQSNM